MKTKKRLLKKPVEKMIILINSVVFLLIGCGIESFIDNTHNMMILAILMMIFSVNLLIQYKYTNIFKD